MNEWNKDSVDTPRSLITFGTSPSFPSMNLPDLQRGATLLRRKQTEYFQERADRLREQIRALESLAADTQFLNAVEKGFEPIVGRSYWVYETNGRMFLSMISPSEWRYECYGEFMLSGDGTWIRNISNNEDY